MGRPVHRSACWNLEMQPLLSRRGGWWSCPEVFLLKSSSIPMCWVTFCTVARNQWPKTLKAQVTSKTSLKIWRLTWTSGRDVVSHGPSVHHPDFIGTPRDSSLIWILIWKGWEEVISSFPSSLRKKGLCGGNCSTTTSWTKLAVPGGFMVHLCWGFWSVKPNIPKLPKQTSQDWLEFKGLKQVLLPESR